MAVTVEVVNHETKVDEYDVTTHTVEVVRRATEPLTVEGQRRVVDVVRAGGTVTNVSSGTSFPSKPYEGQVFIKL